MPKKSFKDNPALQFISETDTALQKISETMPAAAPQGYKVNPLYIETKSKRLQLVMQPSLYERVKAAADNEKLSVNEFIHRTLDAATKNS